MDKKLLLLACCLAFITIMDLVQQSFGDALIGALLTIGNIWGALPSRKER